MQKIFQKANVWSIAGIIILLGFLTYSNAIFHPFVHDDVVFIQQNPNIADLSFQSILNIFSIYSTSSAGNIINPYYRPILEIVYRLEYRFFGFNPYWFHFLNIVIHILNSILLYILINLIIPERKVFAGCVAILFLIHPVQSEAVACIAGISNLLSAFLFLIVFILYFASKKSRAPFTLYALSLIVFFISLLTKEQSAVLPVLFIIYECCFSNNILAKEKRGDLIRAAVKIIGYFFILALYFIMRKSILGVTVTSFIGPKSEFYLRLLSIPKTLLTYLSLCVFPINLHYFRSVDILEPFLIPTIFLLIVLVLFVLIIRLIPKLQKTVIIFGGVWFILTLLPTLNIIPLIIEYSIIFTAEHFLYLPLAGFIILAIELFNYFFAEADQNKALKIKASVFVLITALFIGMTIKQNTFWRDEVTLFKRALKYEDNISRAHILLGKAYYFKGNYPEAISQANKALKIMRVYLAKVQDDRVKAIYLGFLKGINFDLAQYYTAAGFYWDSIYYYDEALKIDPKDGVLHNNIGVSFISLKDYAKAIWHFEEALKINSNDLMAMNNLALCYINKGDDLIAEAILIDVLKKQPRFLPAKENLMRLYQKQKKVNMGQNQ